MYLVASMLTFSLSRQAQSPINYCCMPCLKYSLHIVGHEIFRHFADPDITLEVQWPDGKYSLLQTTSGCPYGWSSGSRKQDNEDNNNKNAWSPWNIYSYLAFTAGKDFTTYYCTKTRNFGSDNAFIWPMGKYCIARYDGSCPTGFYSGYKYWDDEDSNNKNNVRGVIPDGKYDTNTKVEYCCRSDGNAQTEILLPPTKSFALYRFQGICQRVKGMNYVNLWLHFDDQDASNGNLCKGQYPEGQCDDQELRMCYYSGV